MRKLDEKYRKMRYDPKAKFKSKKNKLTKIDSTLENKWDTTENYTVKPILKIPLIISFIFFILTISIVLLGYFRDFDKLISPKKVIIEIDSPSFVLSGVASGINIKVKNYNPVPITVADIVISHPEGTIVPEFGSEVVNVTRDGIKGGLDSNATYNYNYRPIFYGRKGENKEIKVKVEYHIKGSKSLFVVENSVKTQISNSLLSLEIIAEDVTTSGKNLPFTLKISSNVDREIKRIKIKPGFPSNFTFKDSTPNLQQQNDDEWYIPSLLPRRSEKINFYGILSGTKNTEKVFAFDIYLEIGSDLISKEILVYTDNHLVAIENAFLTTELKLNGDIKDIYVVKPGELISGVFSVKNENDFLIEDLVVEVIFEGNSLDESKVIPGKGFYDADRRKIIYSKIQIDDIKLLRQNDKKKFSFSVNTLPSENESPISITEKEIKIYVNIYANIGSEGGLRTAQANNLNTAIIKAKSDVVVLGKTLYETSTIKNRGPIPPKKDSTTQYVLSFFVKNSGNNLKNTKLTIPLNTGVEITNIYLPTKEKIIYDEDTHTVFWDIENLTNEGTQAKRNIEIQVEVTPNITNVGRNLDLTKQVMFEFFDTFTQTKETIKTKKYTTYIRDEDGSRTSGVVVE